MVEAPEEGVPPKADSVDKPEPMEDHCDLMEGDEELIHIEPEMELTVTGEKLDNIGQDSPTAGVTAGEENTVSSHIQENNLEDAQRGDNRMENSPQKSADTVPSENSPQSQEKDLNISNAENDDRTENSETQNSAGQSEDKKEQPKPAKQVIRVSSLGRENIPPADPESLPCGRPQRKAAKKAESQIREIVADESDSRKHGLLEDVELTNDDSIQFCCVCSQMRTTKYVGVYGSKTVYLCSDTCLQRSDKQLLTFAPACLLDSKDKDDKPYIPMSILEKRKCAQCGLRNVSEKKSLSWEVMEFCNEDCLNKYQYQMGKSCAKCEGPVHQTSMGKYCVRFGLDIKQFCTGACLEKFKEDLRLCSFCQKDISNATHSIQTPGGTAGRQKEFCSQTCRFRYEEISTMKKISAKDVCKVCYNKRPVQFELMLSNREIQKLCGEICFSACKYKHNLGETDQCCVCKTHFEKNRPGANVVFYDGAPQIFCSKICFNVFILNQRKIMQCLWCKVKKYNFDMIKKPQPAGGHLMMCSLNCLMLYQVSVNASSTKKIKCDQCKSVNFAQYHLTMSDSTIRNFCSYDCVLVFQTRYPKTPLALPENAVRSPLTQPQPIPLGVPKRVSYQNKTSDFVDHFMSTLNSVSQNSIPVIDRNNIPMTSTVTVTAPVPPIVVTSKAGSSMVHNTPSITVSKVNSSLKDSEANRSVEKHTQQILVLPPRSKPRANKILQTNVACANKSISCQPSLENKECQTDVLGNFTVPVLPLPVPVGMPLPLPMYSRPCPVPVPVIVPLVVPVFLPLNKDTFEKVMKYIRRTPSNPLEADLLEMARVAEEEERNIKLAEEASSGLVVNGCDEPGTSDASASNFINDNDADNAAGNTSTEHHGVKRSLIENGPLVVNKKPRTCISEIDDECCSEDVKFLGFSDASTSSPALDSSFGLDAWNRWAEERKKEWKDDQEKGDYCKILEKDTLNMMAEELNYLLRVFVKEIKQPNGEHYTPDAIYYMCLGIQHYLSENGRSENIFLDSTFDEFVNTFDEVVKRRSSSGGPMSCVHEEHLWETLQLGVHSPQALLTTMLYFNTKYLGCDSVEKHKELSFQLFMRYWKCQYYLTEASDRVPQKIRWRKKLYVRLYPLPHPNTETTQYMEYTELDEKLPDRSPSRLFDFYVSKCPEQAKNTQQMFYLQPENYCQPDSPVWFSSSAVSEEQLAKILNRLKLVKEINSSLF